MHRAPKKFRTEVLVSKKCKCLPCTRALPDTSKPLSTSRANSSAMLSSSESSSSLSLEVFLEVRSTLRRESLPLGANLAFCRDISDSMLERGWVSPLELWPLATFNDRRFSRLRTFLTNLIGTPPTPLTTPATEPSTAAPAPVTGSPGPVKSAHSSCRMSLS